MDRKPPYSIAFWHEGKEYSAMLMYAASWEDAEARLESLKRTARIDGSDVSVYRANTVTAAPVGLWVMLKTWLLNAFRR